MNIFKSLVGGASALALLLGSYGARAECKKWVVPLATCDVLSAQNCNNPTQAQLRAYYDVIHQDTPEDACYKWALKGYGDVRGNAEPVFDAEGNVVEGSVDCYIDLNENFMSDDNEPGVAIHFSHIDREWCCEVELEGPHANLTPDVWYQKIWIGGQSTVIAFDPADGREFTGSTLYSSTGEPYLSQKTRVRAEKPGSNPWTLTSDLDGSEPELPLDYCSSLSAVVSRSPCDAQVDHMIPRKDIKGCDCGPNSFKNALLISQKLNGEMSNYCGKPPGQDDDPTDPSYEAIQKRKAIIDFYRIN